MNNVLLRISVAVMAALMFATNGWGQSGTASGMREEAITDPVLNLTAFNVTVPAKWHFAGRLLQGTSCSPVPYPVFRATSPDGLTVLERLPRMDWIWGNGPGSGASGNCLPLKREMSANEFVKYMAVMLKADYVSDDPFPADVIAATNKGFAESKLANAAKYRAAGMNPPEEHTDMDRAVVRFKNGSFMMKGQIAVSIYCSGNKSRPIGNLPILESHSCQANVRYVHAVEEQYPAMVKMLENAGAVQNQQWTAVWMQENNRQTSRNISEINQRGAEGQARLKASHEQYMQTQATQQRLHQDFLDTLQRGTTMSMNRTAQAMNSRSTATSNVVDYALGGTRTPDKSARYRVRIRTLGSMVQARSVTRLVIQMPIQMAYFREIGRGNRWSMEMARSVRFLSQKCVFRSLALQAYPDRAI